ncbi:hypothetical protein BGZ61DRAFT_36230 [Ilyonectria robusta]|uniref:uncharacterized protein n=1 Tax=Ilyonectria robusta TaxID=1079257 RepID=UPI001E8D2D48|nr:uncharacterized protein BGZ61DRAFT_36230 [Ilyonectria robusta]KAH8694799.1 hypothetical protein BGZ61DRAFT_36230 [Ilyonectria robusta]
MAWFVVRAGFWFFIRFRDNEVIQASRLCLGWFGRDCETSWPAVSATPAGSNRREGSQSEWLFGRVRMRMRMGEAVYSGCGHKWAPKPTILNCTHFWVCSVQMGNRKCVGLRSRVSVTRTRSVSCPCCRRCPGFPHLLVKTRVARPMCEERKESQTEHRGSARDGAGRGGRGGRNRPTASIGRQRVQSTCFFCFAAICKPRSPPIHTNNPSGKLPSMTVREIVQMACAVAAPSNTPMRLLSLVVSGSY